jgi:hypothetical protein
LEVTVDANEDHRARIERLRRWEAEQHRARATQNDQQEAAKRRHQARRRDWLVRLGGALMIIGVVVGLVHMLRHLAANPGAGEDLAVGYPTAAVLLVIGLVLLGGGTQRAK